MEYGDPTWFLASVEMRHPLTGAERMFTERGIEFLPQFIEFRWSNSFNVKTGRIAEWCLMEARLFGPKISRRDARLLESGDQLKWVSRWHNDTPPSWAAEAADKHHPSKYNLNTGERISE